MHPTGATRGRINCGSTILITINKSNNKTNYITMLGSLNVGTLSGKGVAVVEMMEIRRLEVLCVQEAKWRGDRARMMVGGRKLLHAGGDGRSSWMPLSMVIN